MARWIVLGVVANIALIVAFPVSEVLSPGILGVLAYTCAYWLLASVIILAVNAQKVRGAGGKATRRDYLLFAFSTLALVVVGTAAYLYSTSFLYSVP